MGQPEHPSSVMSQPVDADLGSDPTTSKSAGRGIPHIASNFRLCAGELNLASLKVITKTPKKQKGSTNDQAPSGQEERKPRRPHWFERAEHSGPETIAEAVDSAAVSVNIYLNSGLPQWRSAYEA